MRVGDAPDEVRKRTIARQDFAGNGYEATTRQGVREVAGMDLNGKTALVTGDSRGIGHAAAERLADLGAKTNSAYGLLTEQQYSALPRHRAEHVEAQRCQPVGPGPSPSIRLCGNVSRAATDTARPGSGNLTRSGQVPRAPRSSSCARRARVCSMPARRCSALSWTPTIRWIATTGAACGCHLVIVNVTSVPSSAAARS